MVGGQFSWQTAINRQQRAKRKTNGQQKTTDASCKKKKKALKPNDVNLQIVHMLKNIDLLLLVEPGPLLENMQTLENIDLLWPYMVGATLVHCCTLSFCHLGSEMIITDIQISIQRSSSGLLTRRPDETTDAEYFHGGR